MDPPVSPRSVLPGQPEYHRPHLAMRCRATGAAPARQAPPPAADEVTVPAQDRAGSDDQPHRRQAVRRHRLCKQRQPRPVRPRQPRTSARPVTLNHSELMAQHKDLGVLPPPLPPRQAQQRHSTGDHQEDQLQAHKPKIVPRPGRRRGAGQPTINGASGQVAQVFGTHNALPAEYLHLSEGGRRRPVKHRSARSGRPQRYPLPAESCGTAAVSPFAIMGRDRPATGSRRGTCGLSWPGRADVTGTGDGGHGRESRFAAMLDL